MSITNLAAPAPLYVTDVTLTNLISGGTFSGIFPAQEVQNTSGILVNTNPGSFVNYALSGTKLVKSGAGVVERIVLCDTSSANTITLYDSLTASGTLIGKLVTISGSPYSILFECNFTTGLTAVTSGNNSFTVVYK